MHGAPRQKKLHSTELIKSALWRSPHSTFLTEYNRLPAPSWSWKLLFPPLLCSGAPRDPRCGLAAAPGHGALIQAQRTEELIPLLTLWSHSVLFSAEHRVVLWTKVKRLQNHWDSKLKRAHNGCKKIFFGYTHILHWSSYAIPNSLQTHFASKLC